LFILIFVVIVIVIVAVIVAVYGIVVVFIAVAASVVVVVIVVVVVVIVCWLVAYLFSCCNFLFDKFCKFLEQMFPLIRPLLDSDLSALHDNALGAFGRIISYQTDFIPLDEVASHFVYLFYFWFVCVCVCCLCLFVCVVWVPSSINMCFCLEKQRNFKYHLLLL